MKLNAVDRRKLFWRRIALILTDGLVFVLSCVCALFLRYEFSVYTLMGSTYLGNVLMMLPITIPVTVAVYSYFRLYSSLWEFAGEREIFLVGAATFVASALHIVVLFVCRISVPRSFVFLQFLLLFIGTVLSRFSYRLVRRFLSSRRTDNDSFRRTMIVGAGDAGAVVLRELKRSSHSHSNVVCFVDDDKSKQGQYLYGVRIAGTSEDIVSLAEKYRVQDIIFAIPSASALRRTEILDVCSQTGCTLKMLPGISQIVNGDVSIQSIRPVQIEDLLFRESLHLNKEAQFRFYEGKTVLVTGGGGSIGSEICRQVAKCNPKKLVIFDIYENNAYDIQQELRSEWGDRLDLSVEIGSVRDRVRLEGLFSQHRPQIVFHAAAHKHVPLMEHSSTEAIRNNVFGTYNTADMAEKYGVEKFILISTDKAVNPTNIMGATKRLCEMVVQSRTESKTSFAAVRFGNVLGSNGSVIPLFRKQIANGGPVTITDKRIVRYFMTIPEAAQLVMEAGAMARKGELFVLDMGKPVRIYDLAVNMIKLSGLKPDKDIRIEEIGLRPGEKLYEELLIKTETLDKTSHDLIFIEKDSPVCREAVEEKLRVLQAALEESRGMSGLTYVRDAIKATVSTYADPETVNKAAESAEEMKSAAHL